MRLANSPAPFELPSIQDNQESIDYHRERFSRHLDALIAQTDLDTLEGRRRALAATRNLSTFYLGYMGFDVTDLQRTYGEFVHQVAAANWPRWAESRPMPPPGLDGRIRIGYVSSNFTNHSTGKLFLGWLKNHDRRTIEVHCYFTGKYRHWSSPSGKKSLEPFIQMFQHYSEVFLHVEGDIETLSTRVADDRLHILVFTEVGIDPLTTQLAAQRLAPVQCASWGNPVTSGIPTIDYYLSGELMEPRSGQDHYTEHLIRLPHIGVCYGEPRMSKLCLTRDQLGIPRDRMVYLCVQSLLKYLPKYDYLFPAIAQRVPRAVFVFLQSSPEFSSEPFERRLDRSFERYNLKRRDFCIILPRQNWAAFMSLNTVSDAFLDSFGWSGATTALEAIYCNLPVVTCPGTFMRGRHSYGCLKRLELDETIARDEQDYVDIAVHLGRDSIWRSEISDQLANRKQELYNDTSCVTALEQLYRQVVEEKRVDRDSWPDKVN